MTAKDEARKWYGKGAEDFIPAEDAHHFTKDDVSNQFEEFYGNQFANTIDHEGSGYQDQYEFKLPNGKKIVVGKLSTDFFEKIRALPVPTKLEMMNITIDDMRAAFKEQEQILISATILVFASKWLDKVEGAPISFADPRDNEYRFGLPYSSRSIIARLKGGKLDVFKATDAIFKFIREECKPKLIKGKFTQFDTAHYRVLQDMI